jgi:hypothetical protein
LGLLLLALHLMLRVQLLHLPLVLLLLLPPCQHIPLLRLTMQG